LLPAGISSVEGTFSAGDPVDLVSAGGMIVARGLVNYDAVELPACSAGRRAIWPASSVRRTA
jgi:glutamate 5-kinase